MKEHADGLGKLADKLLEKEVIFAEDLEKIFGKRKDSNGEIIIEDEIAEDKPVTKEEVKPENPQKQNLDEKGETPKQETKIKPSDD